MENNIFSTERLLTSGKANQEGAHWDYPAKQQVLSLCQLGVSSDDMTH